jgi:hypothetical protein
VRQPAACFVGRGRIDRGISNLDVRNFPFLVHYVSDAVCHPVRAQNTIRLCGRTIFEIAQQGECQFELFGENFLGGNVVGTDAKDFRVVAFEFCDTSLVRGEFLRSATGESGGKERHDHWAFAFEIGQRDFTAHGGTEGKVGRGVAHLERGGIAGLLGEHCRA